MNTVSELNDIGVDAGAWTFGFLALVELYFSHIHWSQMLQESLMVSPTIMPKDAFNRNYP